MADERSRFSTEVLTLRSESGKIIEASSIASKIENMEPTPEGTLRSVQNPGDVIPVGSFGSTSLYKPANVNRMGGVFHARLKGRDILLMHHRKKLAEIRFNSPRSSANDSQYTLLNQEDGDLNAVGEGEPQFPTQFELTDKGIVFVPQDYQRAWFYDGQIIGKLGYDTAPSPPIGLGPETGVIPKVRHSQGEPVEDGDYHSVVKAANSSGYILDGASSGYREAQNHLHESFGKGRLGTLSDAGGISEEGKQNPLLLKGSYQASVQFVDYWGNLSPLSPRSNEVVIETQTDPWWHIQAREAEDPPHQPYKHDKRNVEGDDLLKHIFWAHIPIGPKGTIGRRLYRTKDTVNSGTAKLFFVPANVGYGQVSAFATIPDGITEVWPDNVPDGFLTAEAQKAIPVPGFKLCRLAMGRLWIANLEDEPGALIPSLPNRYGTFAPGTKIKPDPSGGHITGLWNVAGGLLAFTTHSMYLVTPNDDGTSFRAATLSTDVGCVAPSSLANRDDGSTVWLGAEGFYQYKDGQVGLISKEINETLRRINKGRALQACAAYDSESKEYRCWVPLDASTLNNHCLSYDGEGWRSRTGESIVSVCTSKDYRKYLFAMGKVSDQGDSQGHLFVLDRDNGQVEQTKTYVIETSWIEWQRSSTRKTAKTLYLNLRESFEGSLDIKVYRDWRKADVIYRDTSKGLTYSPEDVPAFWGSAEWEAGDSRWVRKRPFWKRVDIEIPSCEVYKIRIESQEPFEFVGMTIDEEPKIGGRGSRIP